MRDRDVEEKAAFFDNNLMGLERHADDSRNQHNRCPFLSVAQSAENDYLCRYKNKTRQLDIQGLPGFNTAKVVLFILKTKLYPEKILKF